MTEWACRRRLASCSHYTVYSQSVVFAIISQTGRPGEPPIAPGHWLWGNGKEFNEHAVKFLARARDQLGDVFTIRFFNQHWTMVLDVHSFERFSREKNFDFDLVQKQVNRNVFHYTLHNARKMISEAGQKVNGKHLFTHMEHFARNLGRTMKGAFTEDADKQATETTKTRVTSDKTVINNNKNNINNNNNNINKPDDHLYDDINKNPTELDIERLLETDPKSAMKQQKTMSLEDGGWKQDYLRDIASETFFSAVFYTIFGHGKPGHPTSFQPRTVHKNFDKFHTYFNYLWLGLPRKWFPGAVEAANVLAQQPSSSEMTQREGCSDYIKYSTEFMLKQDQSEADIVGHNLVFLHVNYNTFRVVFWCMYKLMEDAKAMAAVRKEVEEAVEAKRSGDNSDKSVEFTVEDINKLQVLESFVKETIRWSSGVFMVRYCTDDTEFTTDNGKTYHIRKGDKVAIYPPVIHNDPEIFHHPETFIHDRFVDAEFFKDGKRVKNPLIGFGSLCPGQKLTYLEIKWFVMNLVNNYKIELVEGQATAPNTAMYGHEILPPTNDVLMRMKPREDVCCLHFVNDYSSRGKNSRQV